MFEIVEGVFNGSDFSDPKQTREILLFFPNLKFSFLANFSVMHVLCPESNNIRTFSCIPLAGFWLLPLPVCMRTISSEDMILLRLQRLVQEVNRLSVQAPVSQIQISLDIGF